MVSYIIYSQEMPKELKARNDVLVHRYPGRGNMATFQKDKVIIMSCYQSQIYPSIAMHIEKILICVIWMRGYYFRLLSLSGMTTTS